MNLTWLIARRYLSSQRGARLLSLITLISIGGVMVGVMALIIVTSVMNGLQQELRDKILGAHPHVWVSTFGSSLRVDDWPGTLDDVRAVDGVVAAAPFVNVEVAIRNRAGHVETALLRGLDPAAEGTPVTELAAQIQAGSLTEVERRTDLPPILVGHRLGDKLQVFGGEVITILSIGGGGLQVTPLGTPMVRIREYEVVGRFDTGIYEFDARQAIVTLEDGQDVANLGHAVSGIEVRVPDPDRSDVVARRIGERLGYPFMVVDWREQNQALFAALELEKIAMGIILLLIVIVAAFNIISTLVMMVADKTREIGILKSMGLTAKKIRRIFILQGLAIGFVGTALGAIAGFILVIVLDRTQFIRIPPDVYFIDRLPVAVDVLDTVIIISASLVISVLATIYPASQAAKLTPVEAIRHD